MQQTWTNQSTRRTVKANQVRLRWPSRTPIAGWHIYGSKSTTTMYVTLYGWNSCTLWALLAVTDIVLFILG